MLCSLWPAVRLFVFVCRPFRALTRRNRYPGLTPRAIACRSFGAGSSPKGAVENSQGRQPLDSGLLPEEPCRGGTSWVATASYAS